MVSGSKTEILYSVPEPILLEPESVLEPKLRGIEYKNVQTFYLILYKQIYFLDSRKDG